MSSYFAITALFAILICAMWGMVFLQDTDERANLTHIFSFPCILHMAVGWRLDSFSYFFSAGVVGLAIVSLICAYGAKTRLTDDLINIATLSIALNAYGFVTDYNGQPILSYQLTMVALYFIAILSLLRKDCADGNQPRRWHNSIRLFVNKGFAFCQPTQKETGN